MTPAGANVEDELVVTRRPGAQHYVITVELACTWLWGWHDGPWFSLYFDAWYCRTRYCTLRQTCHEQAETVRIHSYLGRSWRSSDTRPIIHAPLYPFSLLIWYTSFCTTPSPFRPSWSPNQLWTFSSYNFDKRIVRSLCPSLFEPLGELLGIINTPPSHCFIPYHDTVARS